MRSWEELLLRAGESELDLRSEPLSDRRLAELRALVDALGLRVSNLQLLDQALTHGSFTNQSGSSHRDYQSLEFLGDAILGLVISEILYRLYPDHSEGELSRFRSHLVSRRQLARLSASCGLDRVVRLGSGEEQTGGRRKAAILGDVFESLIAAVYLDGGLEPVREFVMSQFRELFSEIAALEMAPQDHKSRLQELLHARGQSEPDYLIVAEEGPDHRKQFLVEARIMGRPVAQAWGHSRKRAEQRAAQEALDQLQEEIDPTD